MKLSILSPIIATISIILLAASSLSASGSDSEESPKADKATLLEATEEYHAGLKHMDKARQIAIVGDSAFAYNYRATASAKATREYQKAVKNFKSATKLNPEFKESFNNLGYCYRKLGKFDKSLKAYDSAIKLDNEFAQARVYRGETHLAMGNLEKAEGELASLLKMQSSYADTLAQAIKLYRLNAFSKQLDDSHGEQ